MHPQENHRSTGVALRSPRGRRAVAALALLAGLIALVAGGVAPASVKEKLEDKRSALQSAQDKEGVLASEIAAYSDEIDTLTGQVATLRNREAKVQAELDEAERRLAIEQENLEILRERLARSVRILRERLVAIYKSEEPDALTVVLEADGFDEVLEQYEYLERIESQDSNIVSTVRELRNQTRATVNRITAVRDAIAAKRRELERTRIELEQREAELSAARESSRSALNRTRSQVSHLEGEVADLEEKERQIQAALQAAAEAQASNPETPETLPAGPVRGGSGDMIWPVDGPVTSPFGQRWGRLHAGIDISAPGGTPIRAAKAGSIALAAPYGGYGNYTCINHGGGLSTCYAHQSSFEITSGSVGQGDVIGYVGNTGNSFGDHLHFEVRVNGSPVDPMGYL